MERDIYQNFNYHTHTKRCGHAGLYNDEDYIYYARINGIRTIGFSEHAPFSNIEFSNTFERMMLEEFPLYIEKISKLKKENPDITILIGLESEYDKDKEQFLSELRSRVEYMTLSQHFVKGVSKLDNESYPLEYASTISDALDTGLFDIVVDPCVFINVRNTLTTEEKVKVFDENVIKASEIITSKAREWNIPIELNVNKYEDNTLIKKFYQIASKNKVKIILGMDVHNPKDMNNFRKKQIETLENLGISLNLVKSDYNPIVNRILTQRLDIVRKLRSGKQKTIYTMYASSLLNKILEKMPSFDNKNEVSYYLTTSLKSCIDEITKEGTLLDEKEFRRIEELNNSNKDAFEKSFHLQRIKENLKNTNSTIGNLTNLINHIIENINYALEMGASNKTELTDIVLKLIEIQTTKDESIKNVLINELSHKESDLDGKSNSSKLIKANPMFESEKQDNNLSWNNGFINLFTLFIILSFIMGVGVGIAYMLIKL